MLVEKRVQIEAIKTDSYRAGKIDHTILVTNGHFIVYMSEKDCMIDLSKVKQLPKEMLDIYNIERIEKLLKPIKVTNKLLLFKSGSCRKARLLENKETGDKIWVDNKKFKMFKGCTCYFIDEGEKYKSIVFKRYDKIIGVLLPINIPDNQI